MQRPAPGMRPDSRGASESWKPEAAPPVRPRSRLKLRNVSNGAQRSGKLRPAKRLTPDMGTPTLMPSSRNTARHPCPAGHRHSQAARRHCQKAQRNVARIIPPAKQARPAMSPQSTSETAGPTHCRSDEKRKPATEEGLRPMMCTTPVSANTGCNTASVRPVEFLAVGRHRRFSSAFRGRAADWADRSTRESQAPDESAPHRGRSPARESSAAKCAQPPRPFA